MVIDPLEFGCETYSKVNEDLDEVPMWIRAKLLLRTIAIILQEIGSDHTDL